MSEKTVKELTEAYVFLRNLEHRLMYVEDAQTHELPTTDEAKARIAEAMNFRPLIKWLASFFSDIRRHIVRWFSSILMQPLMKKTLAKIRWRLKNPFGMVCSLKMTH